MSADDPNANRPGYRETKLGWIPEEWEAIQAKEICQRITVGIVIKPTQYYAKSGVRAFRSANVREGRVNDAKWVYFDRTSHANLKKTSIYTGDLLIVRSGAPGTCCVVPEEFDDSNCIDLVIAAPKRDLVDSQFLCSFINSDVGRGHVFAKQGGLAQKHFNVGDCQEMWCVVPPLEEQRRISDVLSSCDEAIEKTGALIEAKKRQKRALMQQLLTGRKRLPGFEGEWQEVTLSEISSRIKGTADDPDDYPVLSITAGRGFVSQADKFSRVIAGKQVEKYVLLKRGEFSYNKGNSYRYPQGCVYELTEYDEGLVPNVFYSFRLDKERAHSEFIKQYFLAGLHNGDLYRWINSGVRNNGLLNLNAADFFKLPISLPPMSEQEEIGSVLGEADCELDALTDKLAALKQQKKALMQKLLTGQIRVKV